MKRSMTSAAHLLLMCFSVLLATAPMQAQVNLNDGLVAYYPLDGSSQDASGNGNNGVRTGGTSYVADRFGVPSRALSFGGVSNGGKMTVAHSPSLAFSNGATFAFWVRVASTVGTFGNGTTGSGGAQCFFAKEGDAGGGLWNYVFFSNGNLSSRVGNNATSTLIGDYEPYATNQWIHYTVVMSPSGHQIYINGELNAENTAPANFAAMVNRPLVLGRFSSNWYPLNGALDDFRVYNRVLTVDEITSLATAVQPAISFSGAPTNEVCAGQAISLNYSADFVPAPANQFIAELSDAAGSFATVTASASLSSTAQTGSIALTIPQSVVSGSGYRVRIRSSSPAATSDESDAFSVFSLFGGMDDPNAPAGADQNACLGTEVSLNATPLLGATISWSGPNDFTASGESATLANLDHSDAGFYTATYSLNGCTAVDSLQINVLPAPVALGQTAQLSAALNSGLVAHLPLNGNGDDITGNGNNGVLLNGASGDTDRFGVANGSVRLDGTNDFIDLTDGVYFTGSAFTVSVWLNKQSNESFSRYFDFGNGQQNNNVLAFISNGTNGRPGAQIYSGNSAQSTITSPTAVPLNQWHLMTMTYENGTARVYINGVQVVSGPQNIPQNIVRTLCYIGRSNWAADGYANGRFDDFRIYNRALSAAEIQQLVMEQPNALAISASATTVCFGASIQITIENTQYGVNYTVIDANTGNAVAAQQSGNGASLVFTVSNIEAATVFEVHSAAAFNDCDRVAGSVAVTVLDEPATPVVTPLTLCEDQSGVLVASGAPVDGFYRWYSAAVGGELLQESPSGNFDVGIPEASVTVFVSIVYSDGCESERVPATANVINPVAPIDLEDGLILYYTLDQTLEDFSGNNYNGTAFGNTSYVNDRNGVPLAALNSTASGGGGNNYVTAGNPAAVNALTNQVTFAFWIRQTQTWFGSSGFEGFMPLINKWNGSTGLYSGLRMINPSNMSNRVRWRVNGSAFVDGNTNVPIGQWHHVVCTYNGAQLRIYQNGVLTGTVNHTGAIATTGNELQIGRQANGNGQGGITYRGDWDQVRIYNRALTVEEIQVLFNNESILFSNAPFCDEEQSLELSTFDFPDAEYLWSGPNGFTSTQQNPEPIPNADSELNSGTYTLQVTVDGCSSELWSSNVVIHPIPEPPATTNASVCGSGNAVLTASGAPTGGSYRWYTTASGGSPIAGQTGPTLTINNLTQTTTRWVSTVANGCESERSEVTAIYFSDINTALAVSGTTVCTTDEVATVMVQSAEPFVEYQAFLNNQPVSEPFVGGGEVSIDVPLANLALGSNALVIQATQPGCGALPLDDAAIVEVIAAQPASITPLSGTDFCEGESVQLVASPGASYLWNTGETTNAIQVAISGQWSVSVVDANGCVSTSPVLTTTANTVPNPIIEASSAFICPNTTVQLSATGAESYLWSTGSTGSSIAVDEAGNYSVTAFNGGCSAESAVFALQAGEVPNLQAVASSTEVCAGETVALTASGADSYTWSNGVQNGVPFAPQQTQTYSVTGTATNGCSSTAELTVTVNPLPVATITASAPALCGPADNVTLSAAVAGQANYEWLFNGEPLGAQNASSISVTVAGEFTLVVTSVDGCTASESVTLVEGEVPTVNASADATTICEGETALLTVFTEAGNAVQWFFNGQPAAGSNNALLYEASQAGNYTVEVTHPDGCAAVSSPISIEVQNAPSLELTSSLNSLCDGESALLITTVDESGTYAWSFNGAPIPGAGSADLVVTEPGDYAVSFTANGCSALAEITISAGALPTQAAPIMGNPGEVCAGESFVLSVNAQADASQYIWSVSPAGAASIGSGQGTVQVVINPMNSNFSVSVTPQNSCGSGASSSTSVNVTDEFFCFGQVMFAANATAICTGNQVTFSNYTDQQLFFGFTPQWNFGAGASPSTSTSSGPVTVTYTTPGVKTVTLSYVDFFGDVFEQEVKTDYISVANGPTTSPISGPVLVDCDAVAASYSVAFTPGSTYTWSVSAGIEITAGQGSNQITVGFDGSFGTISVVETSASGCQGAPVSISVDCEVGVEGVDSSQGARLYPNPATGQVSLELGEEWQNAEWELLDLQGRRVLSGAALAGVNLLDVSRCAGGSYLLRLVVRDKNLTIRLVVAR